jgi:hypothetical protein
VMAIGCQLKLNGSTRYHLVLKCAAERVPFFALWMLSAGLDRPAGTLLD